MQIQKETKPKLIKFISIDGRGILYFTIAVSWNFNFLYFVAGLKVILNSKSYIAA